MPQATFPFPNGFLWGTATAAQQVEGSNTNNIWSYWESLPGKIKEGGKAGLACDWWGGRWKEDFDRAAETGQNSHRFSVEWSRIQPLPDKWDEYALDHYLSMLRGLKERGMTPLVTLHHFSEPLWFFEQGGWENPKSPELFAAFCRKTVSVLKDYANLWITFNEPNVHAYLGYINGLFPPGKKSFKATFTVVLNMLKAHALAYAAIHDVQKEARAGMAHHIRRLTPYRSWLPTDIAAAKFLSHNLNYVFPDALATGKVSFALYRTRLPQLIGTQDFIGINYYTWELIQFALAPKDLFFKHHFPSGAHPSASGMIANVPQGFYLTLDWARRFGLPILVTENGIDDEKDDLRREYMVEHIHQMWRAMNSNWGIKGYFHWTLVDNFEWERGWTQKFGLWALDPQTQQRTRRPSADLYAAICKENALSYAMVEKFAPQSLARQR
jgi:beta-glucosidase